MSRYPNAIAAFLAGLAVASVLHADSGGQGDAPLVRDAVDYLSTDSPDIRLKSECQLGDELGCSIALKRPVSCPARDEVFALQFDRFDGSTDLRDAVAECRDTSYGSLAVFIEADELVRDIWASEFMRVRSHIGTGHDYFFALTRDAVNMTRIQRAGLDLPTSQRREPGSSGAQTPAGSDEAPDAMTDDAPIEVAQSPGGEADSRDGQDTKRERPPIDLDKVKPMPMPEPIIYDDDGAPMSTDEVLDSQTSQSDSKEHVEEPAATEAATKVVEPVRFKQVSSAMKRSAMALAEAIRGNAAPETPDAPAVDEPAREAQEPTAIVVLEDLNESSTADESEAEREKAELFLPVSPAMSHSAMDLAEAIRRNTEPKTPDSPAVDEPAQEEQDATGIVALEELSEPSTADEPDAESAELDAATEATKTASAEPASEPTEGSAPPDGRASDERVAGSASSAPDSAANVLVLASPKRVDDKTKPQEAGDQPRSERGLGKDLEVWLEANGHSKREGERTADAESDAGQMEADTETAPELGADAAEVELTMLPRDWPVLPKVPPEREALRSRYAPRDMPERLADAALPRAERLSERNWVQTIRAGYSMAAARVIDDDADGVVAVACTRGDPGDKQCLMILDSRRACNQNETYFMSLQAKPEAPVGDARFEGQSIYGRCMDDGEGNEAGRTRLVTLMDDRLEALIQAKAFAAINVELTSGETRRMQIPVGGGKNAIQGAIQVAKSPY